MIKIVTGPDGVVMYQVVEEPGKGHGGIGCVFQYVVSFIPPSQTDTSP